MELTITLPDHVASVFPDPAEAKALALATLTDYARQQAVSVASDEANALIRAAEAPFESETALEPGVTIAERVEAAIGRIEQVAERTVLLAGTLATLPSVGGDPAEVQAAIEQVIGGPPELAPAFTIEVPYA